jgi:hypothetical protein
MTMAHLLVLGSLSVDKNRSVTVMGLIATKEIECGNDREFVGYILQATATAETNAGTTTECLLRAAQSNRCTSLVRVQSPQLLVRLLPALQSLLQLLTPQQLELSLVNQLSQLSSLSLMFLRLHPELSGVHLALLAAHIQYHRQE